MTDTSIPVDLLNPGQVFACLGFMEASAILLGDVEAGFDWSDETNARFVLRAGGMTSPFAVVLQFLARATVVAETAHRNSHAHAWKQGWGELRELADDAPFPIPEPPSPATLPARLSSEQTSIAIDYWGDETRRSEVKFWGGAGGYPGAALIRDALDLVRDRCETAEADPFSVDAVQSSSLRLDWRRDYIPIDSGFSLNSHGGRIATVGFPLVEILAAIGLGDARPNRIDALTYRYGVIGRSVRGATAVFPPPFVRAALSCPRLPFASRYFHMSLGWPAQEGQARAITTVIEETAI